MRSPTPRGIFIGAVALVALLALIAPSPQVAAQTPVRIIMWFLGFNTTLPPFDNLAARQAVASALDRAQLAAADANLVLVGLEPPGCLGHNPNAKMHPYSPQRAQELWGQSGVKAEDMGDLNLWFLSALRRGDSRRELEIISTNLQAIGLKPVLREFGNYRALDRIATLSVVKMSYWGIGWNSLDCQYGTFLEDLVHSQGDFNRFGYNSPEVDALIERAKAAGDRQTKVRLFREAQDKVIEDAIIVPVWWWQASR